MTIGQLVFSYLSIGIILGGGLGFLTGFLFGHSEGYEEARYDVSNECLKILKEDYYV